MVNKNQQWMIAAILLCQSAENGLNQAAQVILQTDLGMKLYNAGYKPIWCYISETILKSTSLLQYLLKIAAILLCQSAENGLNQAAQVILYKASCKANWRYIQYETILKSTSLLQWPLGWDNTITSQLLSIWYFSHVRTVINLHTYQSDASISDFKVVMWC